MGGGGPSPSWSLVMCFNGLLIREEFSLLLNNRRLLLVQDRLQPRPWIGHDLQHYVLSMQNLLGHQHFLRAQCFQKRICCITSD